jgi:hypothetical protein
MVRALFTGTRQVIDGPVTARDAPRVMELSIGQRQAVTKKKVPAYKRATRSDASRILDELVDLTGCHLDHARASLRFTP